MAGRRHPSTVAYDDQLLEVLRQFGVGSTRQVAETAGPLFWPPDGKTAQRLRWLAAAGLVERLAVPGWRFAYWRLAAPLQPLDQRLVDLDWSPAP